MALRVGAEDKKKVYLAAALVGIMVILLVRFLWQTFGPSGPAPAPPAVRQAAPVQHQTRALSPQPSELQPASPAEFQQPYAHEAFKISGSPLDPTLHPEWMRAAESLSYTGNGRNIFSLDSSPVSIPQPVASARQRAAEAAAAQRNAGPPPPPRIDLQYYGYAAEKNGRKQVFLLHGDDIFIASQGDVVDRRYRVSKIGDASVEVEDLPFHNTQTLSLTQ